jgi:hypothetical protein
MTLGAYPRSHWKWYGLPVEFSSARRHLPCKTYGAPERRARRPLLSSRPSSQEPISLSISQSHSDTHIVLRQTLYRPTVMIPATAANLRRCGSLRSGPTPQLTDVCAEVGSVYMFTNVISGRHLAGFGSEVDAGGDHSSVCQVQQRSETQKVYTGANASAETMQ